MSVCRSVAHPGNVGGHTNRWKVEDPDRDTSRRRHVWKTFGMSHDVPRVVGFLHDSGLNYLWLGSCRHLTGGGLCFKHYWEMSHQFLPRSHTRRTLRKRSWWLHRRTTKRSAHQATSSPTMALPWGGPWMLHGEMDMGWWLMRDIVKANFRSPSHICWRFSISPILGWCETLGHFLYSWPSIHLFSPFTIAPGCQERPQPGLGQAAACHGGHAGCAGEVWRCQSQGHGHQGATAIENNGNKYDIKWYKWENPMKHWGFSWDLMGNI